MNEFSNLRVDGNKLTNDSGEVVAEMKASLGSAVTDAYGCLFANAPELLATLESVVQNAFSEYKEQYLEALEFNNHPARVYLGSPLNHPQPPEWVLKAAALVARAKGEKGDAP